MNEKLAWIVPVLVIFSPLFLTAATEPIQDGIFSGDLTVTPLTTEKGEPLTVDEATRIAVIQNFDIGIARLDRTIEQHELPRAKAVYDTGIEANGTYEQDLRERANIVLGQREITGIVDVTLDKKIPTGTTLRVTGNTERHSTTSAFTSQDRNYTTFMEVGVEQPLLKNFFGLLDRAKIQKVKLNVEKFHYETLDEIESTLARVRNQYWELVFAFENYQVSMKDLRKAQDFLAITRNKLDIGLSEKPDRFAAESNVRKRVLDVLTAETQLYRESYALKVLLNLPQIPLIVPTVRPQFQPVALDMEEEIRRALERRRDLKALELEREQQLVEVKIKSNERLPDLNFEGAYATTGFDRKLSAAQGKPFAFERPHYFAGFHFDWDLENRDARYAHRQEVLGLKKIDQQIAQKSLAISKEVDDAIREVLLSIQEVKQTQEITRLEQKKLEEEERNFHLGRSDSKTIIDFQEDVIAAERQEIRALVDHAQALENYLSAGDQLLDSVGLTEESAVSGEIQEETS